MRRIIRILAPRVRLWGHLLLLAASLGVVGWAWLFYKNVWDAAIPAFGSPEPYLESLRWLLARYLLAGGGLLVAWLSGLAMVRSSTPGRVHGSGRQRQMG
ncbi:MAG: hypothetical protein ACOX3I_01915 [Limnochordia bacterium]|jgi:hypothetical protein